MLEYFRSDDHIEDTQISSFRIMDIGRIRALIAVLRKIDTLPIAIDGDKFDLLESARQRPG